MLENYCAYCTRWPSIFWRVRNAQEKHFPRHSLRIFLRSRRHFERGSSVGATGQLHGAPGGSLVPCSLLALLVRRASPKSCVGHRVRPFEPNDRSRVREADDTQRLASAADFGMRLPPSGRPSFWHRRTTREWPWVSLGAARAPDERRPAAVTSRLWRSVDALRSRCFPIFVWLVRI